MENKGVSPVIATVLLIVVTVLLVSVVAVVAMGLVGKPVTPVMVTLRAENYALGMTTGDYIVFIHEAGDNLKGAFAKDASTNTITLNNLIIRIDGKTPATGGIFLNGYNTFTTDTLSVGDYLQIQLPTDLKVGSIIIVAWKPTNQTLLNIKVS